MFFVVVACLFVVDFLLSLKAYLSVYEGYLTDKGLITSIPVSHS